MSRRRYDSNFNSARDIADSDAVEQGPLYLLHPPDGGGWVIVTYRFTFERPDH